MSTRTNILTFVAAVCLLGGCRGYNSWVELQQQAKVTLREMGEASVKAGDAFEQLGSAAKILAEAGTNTLHAVAQGADNFADVELELADAWNTVPKAIVRRIDQSTNASKERMQWLRDNLQPLAFSFAAVVVIVTAFGLDRRRRKNNNRRACMAGENKGENR